MLSCCGRCRTTARNASTWSRRRHRATTSTSGRSRCSASRRSPPRTRPSPPSGRTTDTTDLTGIGEPRQLKAARISSGVLTVLGVRPALGRGFVAGEDAPGGAPVVVLSQRLWREQFRSDPQIAGKGITIGGSAVTVAGVMPAGFSFPDPSIEVYLPRIFEPSFLAGGAIDRGSGYLSVIARPKDNAGSARVQADLDRLAAADRRSAFLDADLEYRTIPLMEQVTGGVRPTLLLFSCAVGVVLLIACANVANLLLAKDSFLRCPTTRPKSRHHRLPPGRQSSARCQLGGRVGFTGRLPPPSRCVQPSTGRSRTPHPDRLRPLTGAVHLPLRPPCTQRDGRRARRSRFNEVARRRPARGVPRGAASG